MEKGEKERNRKLNVPVSCLHATAFCPPREASATHPSGKNDSVSSFPLSLSLSPPHPLMGGEVGGPFLHIVERMPSDPFMG